MHHGLCNALRQYSSWPVMKTLTDQWPWHCMAPWSETPWSRQVVPLCCSYAQCIWKHRLKLPSVHGCVNQWQTMYCL